MGAYERAKREIELACKRENPDWDGKSFDYGCSCYQNALDAFKVICDAGHSGFSYGLTKNILIKLLNDVPLSPILENDDSWVDVADFHGPDSKERTFQNARRSSLFKNIDENGVVSYSDVDRVVAIDAKGHGWHNGMISKIVNEMFPIAFPYMPACEPYKVYMEEYLDKSYEGDGGDYNAIEIKYVKTPEGDKVDINRYFVEGENDMIEVSEEEFRSRR